MPSAVADQLVARTAGNPLALVELPEALSPEQLAGTAPLPPQLPVTEGVERVFLDRARRLPRPVQTALLVAAADDVGHAATVRKAAAVLGVDDDVLDAVERSGLVRIRDGQVELRHPLVRSAVYTAATSSERRQAHRALAEALSGPAEADRRAWHRAAATEDVDEAVAAELDAVAARARGRGGQEAASAALERAAELTAVGGDERGRRRYGAAVAAWLAGQPVRARALADTALGEVSAPGLRADIALLRARIEWNTGSLHLGHRMVLTAAVEIASADVEQARELAMFAAGLASVGATGRTDVDPVALVAPAGADAPPRVRGFEACCAGSRTCRAATGPKPPGTSGPRSRSPTSSTTPTRTCCPTSASRRCTCRTTRRSCASTIGC